ncbi:MAG: hypothetical protein V4463_12570 [Pseudomonadota bacterium]
MARLNSIVALRLQWEARRQLARLGWGATLGCMLLLAAAATAWQSAKLIQRQAVLHAEIAQVRKAPPVMDNGGADGARRIAAFQAYLPLHETIPEQLKTLVEVADKNGIVLARADYKPVLEDNADFMRYQLTLPVKADYANIQAFIVKAMRALPTLTLDSVTFKREQIETGDVEARLQFSLLLRKKGASK